MEELSNPQRVGLKIRSSRQKMGYSLRALAARTQLTASFLSLLEKGLSNVSLESLRRVAEALDVSLLYLISEEPPAREAESAPESGSSPVVKANQRSRLHIPGLPVTYELLTHSLAHKMEVFCGQMAPGAGNVARALSEPTDECIYVVSGTLTVGLEEENYALLAGDTITFAGKQLRNLSNPSAEPVVWISFIQPPAF